MLSIHAELGFQIGFTVVIALAACVAIWRLVRIASRRSAAARSSDRKDGSV